jgi:ankyrin repeat protein
VDDDGRTLLHWAAKEGREEFAQGRGEFAQAILRVTVTKRRHELLVCVANASRGGGSLQPLLDRIAELPPEIVREHMVPHYGGMDVNKEDNKGRTPLLMAAKEGRGEIARVLIAAGADVDKADRDGETPLTWAVKEGHVDIAHALMPSLPRGLAAGADV